MALSKEVKSEYARNRRHKSSGSKSRRRRGLLEFANTFFSSWALRHKSSGSKSRRRRGLLRNRKGVSLKRLRLQLEELRIDVGKKRAKVNATREACEKSKAKVKEKEKETAQIRKSNELMFGMNALIRCGIDLRLDILDAEDERDFVGADQLRQSLSEVDLLASHNLQETVAFLNGEC